VLDHAACRLPADLLRTIDRWSTFDWSTSSWEEDSQAESSQEYQGCSPPLLVWLSRPPLKLLLRLLGRVLSVEEEGGRVAKLPLLLLLESTSSMAWFAASLNSASVPAASPVLLGAAHGCVGSTCCCCCR
jgi:hypothetical protein